MRSHFPSCPLSQALPSPSPSSSTSPTPLRGFVPPYEILRTLRAAGFQPLAPPLREGTTYVVRALDFRGVPVPGRGRCPFRCHPRCQPHRCRSGTLSLRAGILWPARSTALSARRYRTRLRSALHRRVRNIIRSTSYRAHSRAIAASAACQSRCDHCEGKKAGRSRRCRDHRADRAAIRPVEQAQPGRGCSCDQRLRRKKSAPDIRGACSRLANDPYAAFWFPITVGPLALPLIGIERGFFASGISRTKSTCKRPFSRLAPFTRTKSASWNTRSKVRAAMP